MCFSPTLEQWCDFTTNKNKIIISPICYNQTFWLIKTTGNLYKFIKLKKFKKTSVLFSVRTHNK